MAEKQVFWCNSRASEAEVHANPKTCEQIRCEPCQEEIRRQTEKDQAWIRSRKARVPERTERPLLCAAWRQGDPSAASALSTIAIPNNGETRRGKASAVLLFRQASPITLSAPLACRWQSREGPAHHIDRVVCIVADSELSCSIRRYCSPLDTAEGFVISTRLRTLSMISQIC